VSLVVVFVVLGVVVVFKVSSVSWVWVGLGMLNVWAGWFLFVLRWLVLVPAVRFGVHSGLGCSFPIFVLDSGEGFV
jgi:hypothetical protein